MTGARIELPFATWPAADRAAWEALFRKGNRLDGRGAAVHWADATRKTNAKHYARWLGWLAANGLLDPDVAPWERASQADVEAYARSLIERIAAGTMAPCTVASALIGLKRVLMLMHAEGDWRWLMDLTNRLNRWAEPARENPVRDIGGGTVFTRLLVELEATASDPLDRRRAQLRFRDTLIWEHRRATHLLTGLVHCAACGGRFTSVGRDYLACANARKLHTCDQRKGLRREALESFVLALVRDQLMQPDAVRAFIAAYHQEINAGRDAATDERGRLEKELRTTTAKLEGLYEAVADGLRTPGLLGKIEALEQRKAELEAGLEAPPPSPVRLHPNLAELYRQKVTALAAALADPLIRDEAIALLRGLIDEVRLGYGARGWSAELQGEITALVGLGIENGKAPRPGLRVEALRSAKVVAGARTYRDRTVFQISA